MRRSVDAVSADIAAVGETGSGRRKLPLIHLGPDRTRRPAELRLSGRSALLKTALGVSTGRAWENGHFRRKLLTYGATSGSTILT